MHASVRRRTRRGLRPRARFPRDGAGRRLRGRLDRPAHRAARLRPVRQVVAGHDAAIFDKADVQTGHVRHPGRGRALLHLHLDDVRRDDGGRGQPVGASSCSIGRTRSAASRVAGPLLEPRLETGVGKAPIVQQHGMTVGELARLFAAEFVPDRAGTQARLTVVPLSRLAPRRRRHAHRPALGGAVAEHPDRRPPRSFTPACATSRARTSRRDAARPSRSRSSARRTSTSGGAIALTALQLPGARVPRGGLRADIVRVRGPGLPRRADLRHRRGRVRRGAHRRRHARRRSSRSTRTSPGATTPAIRSTRTGSTSSPAPTRSVVDIDAGKDADQVVAGWQAGLAEFRALRAQYLLYRDGRTQMSRIRRARAMIAAMVTVAALAQLQPAPDADPSRFDRAELAGAGAARSVRCAVRHARPPGRDPAPRLAAAGGPAPGTDRADPGRRRGRDAAAGQRRPPAVPRRGVARRAQRPRRRANRPRLRGAVLRRRTDDAAADQRVPTRTDTIYDLASLSKLFTSIGAMQLVDQGRLDLAAPVVQYLPAFASHGKSDITITRVAHPHVRAAARSGARAVDAARKTSGSTGFSTRLPRRRQVAEYTLLRHQPDDDGARRAGHHRQDARRPGARLDHRSAAHDEHDVQPARIAAAAHRRRGIPAGARSGHGARSRPRRERLGARGSGRACRRLLRRRRPRGARPDDPERRELRQHAHPVRAARRRDADQPQSGVRRPERGLRLRALPALVHGRAGDAVHGRPYRIHRHRHRHRPDHQVVLDPADQCGASEPLVGHDEPGAPRGHIRPRAGARGPPGRRPDLVVLGHVRCQRRDAHRARDAAQRRRTALRALVRHRAAVGHPDPADVTRRRLDVDDGAVHDARRTTAVPDRRHDQRLRVAHLARTRRPNCQVAQVPRSCAGSTSPIRCTTAAASMSTRCGCATGRAPCSTISGRPMPRASARSGFTPSST